MAEQLTEGDIETILTSFKYSKERIENSPISTPEIRKENLRRIEEVEKKLRAIRDEIDG